MSNDDDDDDDMNDNDDMNNDDNMFLGDVESERLKRLRAKEEKILIIGEDSNIHSRILDRFKIDSVMCSLEKAEKYIREPSFQILIINDGLHKRPRDTVSQFIIENSEIIFGKMPSRLVIITAFDNVRTNLDELASFKLEIARTEKELENILADIFFDKKEQVINKESEKVEEVKGGSQTDKTPKDKGISPHIASDLWTTEDALGYEDYAYAIYKFMTHPKTKAPLTISVQAPWGGGKTSLMRMVRKFIDPEVDSRLKQAAEKPNGELKLKEALNEINQWIQEKTNRKPVENEDQTKLEDLNENASNLTIWFNAWKYENTNQVWAGLIDTVMQQVAARLPVKERELFWLRLNLKRVDTDKIRNKIQNRIFNYFQRGIIYWVTVFIVGLSAVLIPLGNFFNLFNFDYYTNISGISFSLLATVLLTIFKYLHSHIKVNNEPAVVSLHDYLEIPNYSAEFGFVHQAERDLRHVLESIPEHYKPLVIFIDDLDRCSPTKISQVVEAVNLFLAGDFPHCMFVIGMDTEMVAAALQSAHKDMIANLPSDLGIPIGWRFMDKFVQLPFLIPPSQRSTETFVDALFDFNQSNTEKVTKKAQDDMSLMIERRINDGISYDSIEDETKNLLYEKRINDAEAPHFKRNLEIRLKQTIIDKGIQSFTDKNEDIRKLMDDANAFDYFTGNPRELKRFVNAFRFNYFLWWAQNSQGEKKVSIEQLLRWTVLSMKWAEVVRWLRRGDGNEWETSSINEKTALKIEPTARLKLLEEVSIENKTFPKWQQSLEEKFHLDLNKTNWLNDEDLFQFFRKEVQQNKEGKRLSDGIGKGIW